MLVVEHQQLAQFAVADDGAKRGVFGVEAAHEAHLDALVAERGFGLDDLPGAFRVRGQRLFAEDGDVLRQGLVQDVLVQEARGGDEDGVDVAVVQGFLGVGQGHGARNAFDGGLRAGQVNVDDGGNFSAVDALVEALDVVRAHAAGADDGDAEGFSHCSVLCVVVWSVRRQLTAVREPQDSR